MKQIILFTLIFSFSGFFYITAQTIDNSPEYVKLMNNPNEKDFKKIQLEFNNYFLDKDKGRGSGYKQFKRWEMFVEPRIGPDGQLFNIPAKTMEEYNNYTSTFNANSLPLLYDPGYWISLGPDNYTLGNGWNGGIGRVNCIAFHPTDNNTLFVGTPAGGLWKKDGSNPWEPLTDGLPLIGISGIAMNYNNPDIIYILTGDGDGYKTRSIGILKSINGGQTWQSTGLSFGLLDDKRGFKLLIHPTNPQKMFTVFNDGIYMTTDGWQTDTIVQSGYFYDIEFKPGNPSVMYAASNKLFYKSTDGGYTWDSTATGLPTAGKYRIAIGVTPDDASVVYLLYGQDVLNMSRPAYKGLYRSHDSGTSFNLKSDSPNILGYESDGSDSLGQYSYDLAIAVSPTNSHEVHIGGINCWKSNDNGVSWTLTSYWYEGVPGFQYTHADIHELIYHPTIINRLYCGSDGGVFKTIDNGDTWTDMSDGLVITQFYRIGTTPQDINKVVGGTQDNGGNTLYGNSFTHDIGGDAFSAMIDYTNTNIIYQSNQTELYKSTDNGISFNEITPDTVHENEIWDVGWIMHPTDPQTLYLGHTDIWKTTDGGVNWTPMGTPNLFDKFIQIAHGVNNTGRIYGVTVNNVYMTNNSGSNWSNITAGLPVGLVYLSYVAVNPLNSATVYVTCSGYESAHKVYKSINAGSSWNNITGSLPNIPVNCIVCDSSPDGKVYIGTDVGVFYRDDNIGDWVPFFKNLPNVIVNEMEINTTSNKLVAGTFGRGIWQTKLYGQNACPFSITLNNSNNPPSSVSQFHSASDHVTSTATIYQSIGATVTYKAGNYVLLQEGFETEPDVEFEALLGPCSTTTVNSSQFDIKDRISGSYSESCTKINNTK